MENDNECLNKIYDIFYSIGFVQLKEWEIVFNPPSTKIDYLKKKLIYLKYKTDIVIIDNIDNKIFLNKFRFIPTEKEWEISYYFIPDIINCMKEKFPKEIRKYKIKKLLK